MGYSIFSKFITIVCLKEPTSRKKESARARMDSEKECRQRTEEKHLREEGRRSAKSLVSDENITVCWRKHIVCMRKRILMR